MKKQKNEKLIKWSTKDIIGIIAVLLVNIVILYGLIITAIYLSSPGSFAFFDNGLASPLLLLLLLVLSVLVLVLYFFFEERDFIHKPANCEMIFLMLEVGLAINFALGQYVDIFLRPLAIPALLALFLTRRKSAVVINAVFCMIVLFMDCFAKSAVLTDKYSDFILYTIFVLGFVSGMIAIFGMGQLFSRLRLILKCFFVSIPAVLCVIVIMVLPGTIDRLGGAQVIADVVGAICSGPIAAASILILLPIFESLFKRLSCFKYAELTDHKSKLIRRLITEAPGTFNHSIVVSNIAEACASAINEDAILARTCAYYHDIGKLRRPDFFGENQPEKSNPHDDLTPELSTNIIKAHTQDGYSLVLKHRLPKVVADICLQHHGTLPIFYFYDKAKKFTDGEVDIAQYSYSGPKPQSKIAAIIMIADGCEAAARTLKDRSRENVMKVVRKLVDDRMKLGQFDECEITMKELTIIIHTIVNNLSGIYHSRVEYPKVNLKEFL